MRKTTYMHDALAEGMNARYSIDDRKTRRQQKHDLFLAFMDNAQTKATKTHFYSAYTAVCLPVAGIYIV